MENPIEAPSEISDRFWLVTIDLNYIFKKDKNDRLSGKWLIFDSIEIIDDYWDKISKATKEGLLGPSCKVSTAKENSNAEDNTTRVICVFTEDYNDKEDLNRIIKVIRHLGIENKLIYKLDSDVGKYKHKGDALQVEDVRFFDGNA